MRAAYFNSKQVAETSHLQDAKYFLGSPSHSTPTAPGTTQSSPVHGNYDRPLRTKFLRTTNMVRNVNDDKSPYEQRSATTTEGTQGLDTRVVHFYIHLKRDSIPDASEREGLA